jgi:hypothetical protein
VRTLNAAYLPHVLTNVAIQLHLCKPPEPGGSDCECRERNRDADPGMHSPVDVYTSARGRIDDDDIGDTADDDQLRLPASVLTSASSGPAKG